ncbi:GNAT family N-acetyltransferase [Dactylosporangium sp. CS-047395]|uniref:GNAT family N-acetyltransferase n=1 Tax=Dactylosporangium sp. CS-047395 TaxID=3239936 RepID=UPI003D94BDC8
MLRLRAMTQDEFDARLPALHRDYAEDEVRAGRARPESVRLQVAALFARLLPDGVDSPGQLLFSGVAAGGDVVGYIWLALPTADRPQAWVYDVQVDAAFRRQGYGRALMLAAEEELRSRGIGVLGLNVFGHNSGARELYESLGYETMTIQMAKDLT